MIQMKLGITTSGILNVECRSLGRLTMGNFLRAPLPKINRPKVATITIMGEDAQRIIADYVEKEIGLRVVCISFNADETDIFIRDVDIKVKLELSDVA
jgi:hypothetical protein